MTIRWNTIREQTRPWRPVLTLLLASLAACMAHAFFARTARGSWPIRLPWNLFLAWLPLWFALVGSRLLRASGWRRWLAAPLVWLLWLFFFPNAPYICTDLIHLRWVLPESYQIAVVLLTWFAMLGLLLGFISLELMRLAAERLFGRAASWLLAGTALVAAGFGVFLGRDLRLNSWEVISGHEQISRVIADTRRAGSLASDLVAFVILLPLFLLALQVVLRQMLRWRVEDLLPAEVDAADAPAVGEPLPGSGTTD